MGLGLVRVPIGLWALGVALWVLPVGAKLPVLSAVLSQQIEQRFGTAAIQRLQDWQQLVQQNQGVDELQQLQQVNQFFNRLKFTSDNEMWKQDDYWATPLEFLSVGGGDCEDFAIAKYFTLHELGIADERVLITYVKSIKLNQAHMVLTYYPSPDAIPLVLDNLDPQIKPATERPDLVPAYSFNGQGLWQAKLRGQGSRLGSAGDIDLWQELAQRMQQEQKNE